MQLSFELGLEGDLPLNLGEKEGVFLNKLPDDYVIIDIETTGFSAVYDSIIEISALKIKSGEIEGQFSSLVKPNKKISSFISNLTGITQEMVNNAPGKKEVLKNFCNFLEFYPIVGHNVKFDLGFINNNLKEIYNKTLVNNFSDTLYFARKIYKDLPSHKLSEIAKHLNFDTKGAHRALFDCFLTFRIIHNMKYRLLQLIQNDLKSLE